MNTTIKQAMIVALLAGIGGSLVACSGSSGGGGGGDGGGSSSGGGTSSSGGSSGGSSSGSASTDAASDEAVCSTACAALIGCGATYPSTCATDCLARSVFVACAGTAGTDCNALALCAFKQNASTGCSGGAGIPSGTGSCDALRSCNAGCFTSADQASCACECATALAPGKAIDALVEETCSEQMCDSECTAGGTVTSCGSCESAHCSTQVSQCTSN